MNLQKPPPEMRQPGNKGWCSAGLLAAIVLTFAALLRSPEKAKQAWEET